MKFLKNVFVLMIFLSTLVNASPAELFKSLGYSDTYEATLSKAKKENKLMMLVISEKTCPWCRKLENQVLKDATINAFVQKNFVALGLEKNDDIYPKKFVPQVVPTVVFVNPQDESIFFQSYGYKPKSEFSTILKEVNEDFKEEKK